MRLALLVLIASPLLAACGRSERGPAPGATSARPVETSASPPVRAAPATPSPSLPLPSASSPGSPRLPRAVACTRDTTFPSPWKLPEASAAAEVELLPGKREILVVADSGRNGAAMAWSKAGGTRALTLPLDAAASDDLEGMAWLADASGARLYTLTSSGAVRVFVPDGKGGLRRSSDSYPIGPPPASCADLHAVNCGKNWEGLCLRSATAHARCAGYAASKTETSLACVVRDASGRIAIDPQRPPIKLALDRWSNRDGILSDCAFGAPGGPAEDVLLVTTNVYGGSQTYLVDESTGATEALDAQATASNEAIAVDHDGAFYGFLDDNQDLSDGVRYECRGWKP
ncbi:MAG TPA: hypothetical protein VIY73_06065 [Polyangiaceae bacterium]